jgi:DNA-binding NtrC family response regulator
VRELRNVVERSVILEQGRQIEVRSLVLDRIHTISDAPQHAAPPQPAGIPPGIVPLEMVEQEMVRRAMDAAANNQTRAAELLGVSRDQLRYRLKKFGIES